MKKLLLVALVAACNGGSGPDQPDPLDLTGTWTLLANAASPELQASCTLTGTLFLAPSGQEYSGTFTNSLGSCQDEFEQGSANVDATIGGFTVVGDQVSVTYGPCTLVGTASDENLVEGQVSCLYARRGDTHPVEGTWRISR